jgi:UDP-N-acetylmuramoyl-tripeptide--D-alanyl-D-alanine ligase
MNIKHLYNFFKNSSGISTDTRQIKQNNIFFALKGNNFDANKFAKQAIEKGAMLAVISDKKYEIKGKTFLVDDSLKTLQELAKYHRNKLNTKIFGITGTNGKTTTKELIFRVLSKKYNTIATKGNLNNHIGVPLSLLSMTEKTEFAVIEMGANHPGEIAQLCQLSQPDYGIITNIGHAHLEGFGSLENLINTKLALFDYVKKNKGFFLLNTDDEILNKHIKNYDKIIKYGNSSDSIVKITESFNEIFVKIVAYYNNANHLINSKLVGKYNISNILAAIAAGIVCGVPENDIDEAIEQYNPQNNRSQLYKTKYNTLVLDMYNANLSSMKAAIENFAELDLHRKMLIIGDMLELGQTEIEDHQKIVDLIKNLNFKDVILVGKRFKKCKLESEYKTFDNVEDLNKYLQQNPLKNYSILIKASNGTGLKKCVEFL